MTARVKKVKSKKNKKSKNIHPYVKSGLLGILILLLSLLIPVIYIKVEPFIKRKLGEKIYIPSYSNQVFYGLTKDNVQTVSVRTAQENFTIYKKQVGPGYFWYINDKKISEDKINNLFDSLYSFDQGSLLSKNPKNHLELGISDLLGSFVTIKAGAREVSFVIGNPSAVLNSFYFRISGTDAVYLSNGSLRSVFTQGKNYWID